MSTLSTTPASLAHTASVRSHSLWALAWRRLRADRVAMLSLAVVVAFLIMLLLSATGVIAKHWNDDVGVNYAPPTLIGPDTEDDVAASQAAAAKDTTPIDYYGVTDPLAADMTAIHTELAKSSVEKTRVRQTTLPFGADKWGRDIIQKTIKGSETSITVGLVAALLSVILGTLLGAVSGYFGGWIDDALNWFYSIFTSIPYLLLILAVAAVLQQKGILSIVLILSLTGWTGTYRLIRAEYMKHKAREYVLAADAIGASHMRKMFVHIFPNVSHVALVQMSLMVVNFIKSEVILSFLGFGVPIGVVSWGSMLNEAKNELILGHWWQMMAASVAMAVLVTAFSLFTDALRDALDPKLKS